MQKSCTSQLLAQAPPRKEAAQPSPIWVELSGCYSASAEGVTVSYEKRSRGAPICALARKLIAAGHDPAAKLLIYRRGTLCFLPSPLGRWASLTVAEGDNSPHSARFVKFSPPRNSGPTAITSRRFSGHFASPRGGETREGRRAL